MTLCRQYKSVCKKPWFFIHVQTDSKDIHTQEKRIISQGKVEGSKNLTDKELIVFYLVSIIYVQQHADDAMLCWQAEFAVWFLQPQGTLQRLDLPVPQQTERNALSAGTYLGKKAQKVL